MKTENTRDLRVEEIPIDHRQFTLFMYLSTLKNVIISVYKRQDFRILDRLTQSEIDQTLGIILKRYRLIPGNTHMTCVIQGWVQYNINVQLAIVFLKRYLLNTPRYLLLGCVLTSVNTHMYNVCTQYKYYYILISIIP